MGPRNYLEGSEGRERAGGCCPKGALRVGVGVGPGRECSEEERGRRRRGADWELTLLRPVTAPAGGAGGLVKLIPVTLFGKPFLLDLNKHTHLPTPLS